MEPSQFFLKCLLIVLTNQFWESFDLALILEVDRDDGSAPSGELSNVTERRYILGKLVVFRFY